VPEAPTFKEAGFDLVGESWYAVYAPAKTPAGVVTRLNKAIVAAVQSPDVTEKLKAFGLVATGTTPAELAAIQKADSERWAPAVKASGFKPEQ
jgi:tripartite-type tricarboxylate transporter receptor subunit TctC